MKKNDILVKISFNFVSRGPIDKNSSLRLVMPWWQTDHKPDAVIIEVIYVYMCHKA